VWARISSSSGGDGRGGGAADGEGSPYEAGTVQQQQQQPQQPQQRGKGTLRTVRRPRLSPAPDAAAGGAQALRFEEVAAAAAARGFALHRRTLGPFYRIVCREGGEDGRILGVTAGFVAPPFGLVHCDTLQIFTRGWARLAFCRAPLARPGRRTQRMDALQPCGATGTAPDK
jgi:hypothetical protein